MLSTHHSGKMVDSNRGTKAGKKKKNKSVMLYNNFMCGVNRMDQLMSPYSPLQKTLNATANLCYSAVKGNKKKLATCVKHVSLCVVPCFKKFHREICF